MNLHSLSERLLKSLTPHRARALAIEHRWCQRSGKISPYEFLFTALGQSSALQLTLSAQASALSQPVTRQAIDQRYTPEAVSYFRAAFEEVLSAALERAVPSEMSRLVQRRFAAVRVFDSTQCALAEDLSSLFPGCGGDAAGAGIKVLLSYDYGHGQVHPLAVLPAKRSDQGLALTAAQTVGPDEIGLFDKGFYSAPAFRPIAERGGYFLVPWPHGVSVRQTGPTGCLQPLELAKVLEHVTETRLDWRDIILGQNTKSQLGPVRLVASRLPEESASRRRAVLRENCRKQGRQVTAQALVLAGWLLLVTNAPAELLPSAAVGYLYRVRWQIELVFKQCKSVLRMHVLPHSNVCRVQCELWARLMLMLLTFVWYQHANAAALRLYDREISFAKVAKFLQQHGQTMARALFAARDTLHTEFRRIWNILLKLARKERQPSRPTTWENFCQHCLPT